MENEIWDKKKGVWYKITRDWKGDLKLERTFTNSRFSGVRKFGTSGLVFDEEHIETKLYIPEIPPTPQSLTVSTKEGKTDEV